MAKPRPKTAKAKEDDNIFYRRQFNSSNNQRDDHMISEIHRSKEQLLEHDAQQELQTPVGDVGIRNERLSKTIAEEEHKKMLRKRNNTVDHKRHGEEEHQEDEE